MTYEIIILPVAQKQLEKLEKSVQSRILSALERIRIRPYAFVKKLSGGDLYRLRIGEHRAILQISDEKMTVYVMKIGHRKNIYD